MRLLLTKNCLFCTLQFLKPYFESKKDWNKRHKFCSKKCADLYWKGKHKNSKNEFKKGMKAKNPIKPGQHLSKGTEFKKGHIGPYHGKRFPHVTGALNNHWKGGVTKLQDSIRKLSEYKLWRKQIFARDNFTCQICFKRNGDKNVDHYPKQYAYLLRENRITSIEQAIKCSQLWDINNGRTLCVPCHKKTETYLRKLKNSVLLI